MPSLIILSLLQHCLCVRCVPADCLPCVLLSAHFACQVVHGYADSCRIKCFASNLLKPGAEEQNMFRCLLREAAL